MIEKLDIKFLKGVGETRAKLMADQIDIHTFADLARYFPSRHIDRTRFYAIAELSESMPYLQVKGHFVSFRFEGEGAKKRYVGVFTDGSRFMECVWFAKTKQISEILRVGKLYILFGRPSVYNHVVSMVHPEIEDYDLSKPPSGVRGVYPLTETLRKRGFTSRFFGKLIDQLFTHPSMRDIPETLPLEIVEKLNLMPLGIALRQMHFPDSAVSLRMATERMKFEELFYIEMQILRFSRIRNEKSHGYVFSKIGDKFNSFYSGVLPFDLTGAQKRVLREIRNDMRSGRQMNRLLQGDVGCGKTLVAFMSLLMAVDNGCQGALMAPTEILASQHYDSLSAWGREIGVNVRLLTGSTRASERREILDGLLDGSVDILVGTHALVEDRVKFECLGIAVIDEQHRFGVAQRARMWAKSQIPPHVLVMTATPIPRTLAMTVYGDLDVSVIDELPPGRKPVETLLRSDVDRNEVNRLIQRQLLEGRQIYIVYPLVHQNEKLSLKSLEEGYERICGLFPEYKVSCVHGQMKSDIKDRQMARFVSGETRIMVATTVIEVGVNVPNASVMVIENAERFGLSQLHQLRGRVGRGADKSFCVLMSKQKLGNDTKKRLSVMTETTDGFLIAEADMKLRGPGDMEGTQQSGLAFNLRVANLARDGQILARARECVLNILDAPQLLSHSSWQIVEREMAYRFANEFDWSQIS